MAIIPKFIYIFNMVLIKISDAFIKEIGKPVLKFIWNCKLPRVANTILNKKKFEGVHIIISKFTVVP